MAALRCLLPELGAMVGLQKAMVILAPHRGPEYRAIQAWLTNKAVAAAAVVLRIFTSTLKPET
jgi:hypothetical protein